MWTICSRCTMARARRSGPVTATGSSEHGRRSSPERRSGRAYWRHRPSAAARTAEYWSASRRPATSSGRGATGRGFWMARRCTSRWWASTMEPRRHENWMDKPLVKINANLTAALDLTVAQRLAGEHRLSFMGDTKGGAFDISAEVAPKMLAAPLNPNGRPNADVVRPWVNGRTSPAGRAICGSSTSARTCQRRTLRCTSCRSSMCEST